MYTTKSMEANNFEIVSMESIKPSSPTPHHLKHFKLSFLDQLSPYEYVPVLLFYSAPSNVDSGYNSNTCFTSSLCDKLKASLADVLTSYYPLCGRIKGNESIDCNDAGVLFIEARVSSYCLATIIERPQVNVLKKLLPIDPHEPMKYGEEEPAIMAVQVNELSCGSVVLGVCISHKITDGVAVASFLNAWVNATEKGISGSTNKPHMEASLLFPTRGTDFSNPFIGGGVDIDNNNNNKDVVTARLVFDETSLFRLRADQMNINGYNCPTRVEVVTALIWKSMMEAKNMASSKEKKLFEKSFATHIVNIRGRMVPPLPEHSIGNFIQFAVTDPLLLVENKQVELLDLAMMVKKAIMRFDADYVSTLVGDTGFDVVVEAIKQVINMNYEGIQWYNFTSWTRFPLYDADFGWGKPIWVSTIIFPVRNNIIFMPTRCGEGIEAWVNLEEQDMIEFERHPNILQYAALVSRASS